MTSAGLPSLLQSFFTDRLLRQRRASPHTIAGYRDSFRLLLHFAKERLGKVPSNVTLEDLNVRFVGDFLDDLENRRKNSARTRNIRLAAVHSFFQYVALEEPAHALRCQQILAMPTKRHECRPVEFLTREESQAMLSAPDLSRWVGRRDRTMSEPRCDRTSRRQICRRCRANVHVSQTEEGQSTCASSQRSNGTSPERSRPLRNRPLARARISRDHPDVSSR